MYESQIQQVAREWFPAGTAGERDGIFSMIRDGRFDRSAWNEMLSILRSIRPPSDSEGQIGSGSSQWDRMKQRMDEMSAAAADPLPDRDVALLARILWRVPTLLIDKLKYLEQRGFPAEEMLKRRLELESEMYRLIGLP